MAKTFSVRAVNMVKWKGEYRIPGEESAVFECSAAERKKLGELVVDHVEGETESDEETADESEE